MKEIKPLGSEKLNGDDKLKRILELTYYGETKNKTTFDRAEYISESNNGGVFGIVREHDHYYVKRGLTEGTLDYIGGMFMKNKNKFSSYGEALKRLEFLKGQEIIQEGTKYVLKQNSPSSEAAPAAPAMNDNPIPDLPPVSADDTSGVPPAGDDTGLPPMGGDETGTEGGGGESLRSNYMAEIQKFAGKLGQELRDQKDKMESDDIKYVLNMIISAIDLDKLDPEDLEEISDKFDRDEEGEMGGEPSSEEPAGGEPSSEEPTGGEPSDQELQEYFDEDDDDDAMRKLEEFVNEPMGGKKENLLSKYSDLGEEDDIKEFDLDEIRNEINHRVGETLSKYFK